VTSSTTSKLALFGLLTASAVVAFAMSDRLNVARPGPGLTPSPAR
jgi:hypothetical protein